MPAEPAAAGVIHDLGYRRYDGPRLGRRQITVALAWHSFRAAFGFGRGPKAKVVPVIALIALCLPAVINAFAMAQGNPRLVGYDTYQPVLRNLVMTVFVAVQAPELVSRDLRSRVLPLYFSRPIRTIDYPLAKYVAFTAACLVMIDVPVLLVGLMWSVVLAAVSLFLASLTGRRAFATGTVAIFFLLTFTLAEILLQVETNVAGPGPGPGPGKFGGPLAATLAQKVAGLFSPFTLFDGIRMWVGGRGATPADNVPYPGGFGAVYALVLVILLALSLAGLAARYRKARLS